MDKGLPIDFLTKGNPPVWLRGDERFVFSTSVILHRNLKGYKFPNKASLDEKSKVCARILGKIHHSALSSHFKFDNVSGMSIEVKKLLFERRDTYCCTKNPEPSDETKVVLVNEDESVVIIINDEDHLQIKVSCPGLNFEKCHEICADVLRQLPLDFSFSPTFGFLTAMPAIVSTGLQAEVTVHLPGIMCEENSEEFFEDLRYKGIMTDGLFGPGSVPHGNIFTLFNQNTIRKSVEEVFINFKKNLKDLLNEEKKARKSAGLLDQKDTVGRAYGTLKYSEKMEFSEAMAGISLLRLGMDDGFFDLISRETLNKLTWYVFPTQIMSLLHCPADEIDFYRSKIIKQAIEKGK